MIALVVLVLSESPASAQTSAAPEPGARQHVGAFWLGLMLDAQLSGPWALWFDTHYDHRAFFVLRPGVTYKFPSGPSVTGGYAYVLTDAGNGSLERQEHRPWAQIVFPTKFGDDWGFSERLRAEVRARQRVESGSIVDGWIAVPRFRAQTALTYTFAKASYGQWFLQPAVEILVNAGDSVGRNFLDQTRASLMLGLQTPSVTIRVGYMDRFVPATTPPTHEHDFVLWVNYAWKSDPSEPVSVEPRPEDQNP